MWPSESTQRPLSSSQKTSWSERSPSASARRERSVPVPGASPRRMSSSETAPARATRLRTSPKRKTHGTEAKTIRPAVPSTSVSRETPAASLPSALASSTSMTTPDHSTGAIARRCGPVAARQRRMRMASTTATTATPTIEVTALKMSRRVSLRSISSADSGQPSHASFMRSE